MSNDQQPPFNAQTTPAASPDPAAPQLSATAVELRYLLSPAGWLTWAMVAGSVLVLGLISGLLTTAALEQAAGDALGNSLVISLMLGGATLGGALSFDGPGGQAGLMLLPLTVTCLVGCAAYFLTRYRSRVDSRAQALAPVVARAALEGAGAALVAFLVFGLVRGDQEPFTGGASWWRLLLVVWAVTTLGALLGRASRLPAVVLPAAWAQTRAVRGELRTTGAVLGVALGVILLLVVIEASTQEANLLAAVPLLLPNLLVFAGALSTTGGFNASAGLLGIFGGSETAYAWDLSGLAWLWFIVIVLALLVLAIRIGLRRPRAQAAQWARVWQLPLATLVLWVVLLPVATVAGVSLEGSYGGTIGISPNVWSYFSLPLAVAIGSALAEVLPGVLYRIAPGLVAFLGGRATTTRWVQGLAASAPVAPGVPAAPPAVAPGVTAPAPATPGQPPQAAAAPLPTPEPMSPEAKRRLKAGLIAAGAVALVVLAGVILVSVLNSSRTPEAAARAYAQLVADGKADEATALVDPGVHNDERVLLTDAAMKGRTSKVTIEDVSVTTSSSTAFGQKPAAEDSTPVKVDYQVDGQRYSVVLSVEPLENSWLFLKQWRVATSMAIPVNVQAAELASVKVGDVTVKLPEPAGFTNQRMATLYAYPGEYTVRPPEDLSEYLMVEETTVTAGDQSMQSTASLEVQPSDALRDAVLEEVQKKAAECGSVPGNISEHCPWSVQSTELQLVELTSKPTGFEKFSLGEFVSSETVITIQQNPSQFNPEPEKREIKFKMHGTVTINDDGQLSVEVNGTW